MLALVAITAILAPSPRGGMLVGVMDEIAQQLDDAPLEWNDAYRVVITGARDIGAADYGDVVEISLQDPRVSTARVHEVIREALGSVEHRDGYTIRTTRTETEWGASGAGTEVLLLLANAGLAVFFERGLELLLTRLKDAHTDRDAHPVGVEEAIGAARYRVAYYHDTSGPDLIVRSVTQGPGPVIVELEEPRGWPRYEVTFLEGNPALSATRVKRVERD